MTTTRTSDRIADVLGIADRSERDAFTLGFADGLEYGMDFTSGRTYDDPALNAFYDSGVNFGQAYELHGHADRVAVPIGCPS